MVKLEDIKEDTITYLEKQEAPVLLSFKEEILPEGEERTLKALNLFLGGKKSNEVAKELGLPTKNANNLYDNFKKIHNPSDDKKAYLKSNMFKA
ncbi:MAG: hypothetical protein LBG48_02830 [Rickettsiales bacterium]|jgi:hypothetical protein|nr:hypothetical protein [Rickettsiales bacterium]